MKSYNDRDCKPIPKYTPSELLRLEYTWNNKLKNSGFSNIEKWESTKKSLSKKKTQLKFIKGHIRWARIKNKEKFLEMKTDTYDYFRLVGLFAHHAPTMLLPTKYKKILQCYVMTGSVSLATKQSKSKIPASSTYDFLSRNLPKIIEFVRKEFGDE